jgi:hypothetical protein
MDPSKLFPIRKSEAEETKILKKRIEELEKEKYSLNRRLEEAENQLNEKGAEIRMLSKKASAQKTLLEQFETQVDGFTKQAKDQYKKYEDYLDGSYILIKNVASINAALTEAVESVLENAILAQPMDLALIQNRPSENTALFVRDAESDAIFRKTIERFSNSEFLKRKKLFTDIKQLFSFRDGFSFKNIQNKYDKLIELTGQKYEKGLLSTDNIYRDQESPQEKVNNDSLDTKDENVNLLIATTCKQIEYLQSVLSNNIAFSVDIESFREITLKLKELTEVVSGYCFKFKDSMKPRSKLQTIYPEPKENYDINNELIELKRMVIEIEKLEYGKLLELREENGKLQIIQNHIKR